MSSPIDLSPEHRVGGVLIPVFALRNDADLGVGDIGSLRQFIDWSAKAGFGVVQLLPINETGGDNSPYNAISSMALDPTTIELKPGTPEDLTESDYKTALAGVDLAALRQGPVQYSVVKPLKRYLLELAFEGFERRHLASNPGGSKSAQAFRQFQTGNALWLESYTLFRALMDENGGTECWDRWPAGQQTFEDARSWLETQPEEFGNSVARKRLFFTYVQWVAYGQWEELKRYAEKLGVALMGDIPLGVSYYSADFFGFPHVFEKSWSGGAPPEPYFKDDPFTQKWGQNWGIPVYAWGKLKDENYAWWRQRVHGVHDLFHLFRIDHILGFYRIYSFPWRPERNADFLPLSADEAKARTGGLLPGFKPRADETPQDREANCREGETLLRVVLEAAGDTRLIGEDLGTVPDYVRPNLTKLGIAGFKIPIWEPDKTKGGLLAGSAYERLSVATYGTHDHEPLRALWNRHHRAPEHERQQLHELCDFAGIPQQERGDEFTEGVHQRLLEALFRTNSWIVICMITDLMAREERFNVPGTAANSNWSQRLPVTMETLSAEPAYVAGAARIRGLLESSGRRVPTAG